MSKFDIQLCQSNTCLYNGICKELNNTNFHCNCIQGRMGIHCELLINYCNDVICLNKGFCRSLLLNYTCECLSSNLGCHCEHVTTTIVIRQYISKSVASIAIIIILITAGYIIILDILTYVFGINLTAKERDSIQRKRALHNKSKHKTRKSKKAIRLPPMNKVAPLPELQKPKERPKF